MIKAKRRANLKKQTQELQTQPRHPTILQSGKRLTVQLIAQAVGAGAFFVALISGVMTLLSVPPWPVRPTIHPAFLDYSSSHEGILFTVKNESFLFNVVDFSVTCNIIDLIAGSNARFRQLRLESGQSFLVETQSQKKVSCGFGGPEGVVREAKVSFDASYVTSFLGLKWKRSFSTDVYTWDGMRWIE